MDFCSKISLFAMMLGKVVGVYVRDKYTKPTN